MKPYNFLNLFAIAAALQCHPDGPILPKPTAVQQSPVFAAAASNLTKLLDQAVSGKLNAGWAVNNLSFSLGVVSLDQHDPGVPAWEYHHRAQGNVNGTKHVNRDSQYLIGSISKVISDYVLLRSGADLDSPVTEYLPQLADAASKIAWKDITLRMLASHLAGAPVVGAFSEYYYLKDEFLAYGFPPIDNSSYPACGVAALNGNCNDTQTLASLTRSFYPVAAPNEQPTYSTVAFGIIMLALKQACGKTYRQLIREHVSGPLRMSSTFPSPGDTEKAVIPPTENSWGSDYGFSAPGGGLVSTLSDLSRFTHGILARTTGLTPAQTRQWLKPASLGNGLGVLAGMPWEILQSDKLVPEHPHLVTVYGKNGGAQQYRSQISVLDSYGLALVVLTAGPTEAQGVLTDSLLATFAPAFDEMSRQQARGSYARRFSSSSHDANGTDAVSATMQLDNDSLLISSLTRGGKDLLKALPEIWTATFGQFIGAFGPQIRLFPTELSVNGACVDGKPVTGEVWRLFPQTAPLPQTDLPGYGLNDTKCMEWTLADWVHYGGKPTDQVIFYKGRDGEVAGLEAPFLRSGILRPSQ